MLTLISCLCVVAECVGYLTSPEQRLMFPSSHMLLALVAAAESVAQVICDKVSMVCCWFLLLDSIVFMFFLFFQGLDMFFSFCTVG